MKNVTENNKIYTGVTKYKNLEFIFVFNGEYLRLIPTTENITEVKNKWLMLPLAEGKFTPNLDLKMENSFLIGHCYENEKQFVFFTHQNDYIGNNNSVLIVNLIGYLECHIKNDTFGKISFLGSEINSIYPVNNFFTLSHISPTTNSDGMLSISIKRFEKTSTIPQEFYVDCKKVSVQFGISEKFSTDILENPVLLESILTFSFEETNDYDFLIRLWFIAKKFISFLCYRNNICMKPAIVSSKRNTKNIYFATLTMINKAINENMYELKRTQCIKQSHIAGHEGQILTDIACNKLYTRHIPKSYENEQYIDAARFIMIITAFEWEFSRIYPNDIYKSEKTILIEKEVTAKLKKLMDDSTGKLKDKYKNLIKNIKSTSLQTKLIKTCQYFDSIIGDLGKNLYELNEKKLVYSEIGDRLAKQRNHFAHGDLDEDFIGLSLLDLMYLEYIIYAMQLKNYGIDNNNIRNAIKELFHLEFAA